MSKNNNDEISDSLWGRVVQYASSVKESWDKDVDKYVEDVMDTDSRSDDELYASTVLQDSAYSVELVAHLVGSVFSNDYTKERLHEVGSAIANTDTYTSAIETVDRLDKQIDKASEQFMQEHPRVQTAFMATEEKLSEATAYVTQEAQTFAKNHPELTNDFKSAIEIAGVVPVVKAARVANGAREGIYTYTADEAKDEIAKLDLNTLKPKEVEHELNRIINHLDTTPKGVNKDATTTLYSGIKEKDMEPFVDNPNYALLDNTEAFKFLEEDALKENNVLKNALEKVHGVEPDFNTRGAPANTFIYGNDKVFPRQEGAFDIISYHLVKDAKGNVNTLVGEKASAQRVLKSTEMVTAVLNKNITHIDGIDKKELFKTLEKEPSSHHQLNHLKTTTYTRNEVANALEIKDPLSLTHTQIDDFLKSTTPEAKAIHQKIEDFKTTIDDSATKAMEKELGENTQPSVIMERGEAVTFNKTDATLVGVATVTIANDELIKQNTNVDNGYNTGSTNMDNWLIEKFGTLTPSAPTQQNQIREVAKDEPSQTQTYEAKEINNSNTFEDNYVEDDFNSMPKNHRPTNLPNNLPQQPLEEDTFDSTAKANEIVEKMFEDNGWNNNYDNSNDMGRDID